MTTDTVADWQAACPTDERGWVWLSVCSRHGRHDPECHLCRSGHWYDPVELVADSALFRSDYAAWHRKHNGAEPSESAWRLRRLFDKRERERDGT